MLADPHHSHGKSKSITEPYVYGVFNFYGMKGEINYFLVL